MLTGRLKHMQPTDEWSLPTRRLGRRVLFYDAVASTNTVAAMFADDSANDGLAILASEQTAGRGQHGRIWQCPPRAGVLLSILIFPPSSISRATMLTAWAAVSVCETIKETSGLAPALKWPNDILIRGRKVCGILIEQGVATVAGIGLNVNQGASDFEDPALAQAGSLALLTGNEFDRDDIARRLITRLDHEYDRLLTTDGFDLVARWHEYLDLDGASVIAQTATEVFHGRLMSLDWKKLVLQTADGRQVELMPEVVRRLERIG